MQRARHTWLLVVAIGFLVAYTTRTAYATTFFWDNDAGDSQFGNSLNWHLPGGALGGPPVIGDSAAFSNIGGLVHVPDGTIIEQLIVFDTAVTLDLGGLPNQMELTKTASPQDSLVIGPNAGNIGSLTLQNGDFTTTDTRIGFSAGSNGSLTVTSNAVWLPNDVYLAFFGGSQATLNVDGGFAGVFGDLEIGDGGTGIMMVSNGGVVASSIPGPLGRDVIGDDLNSDGVVTVTGSGSKWITDRLLVGDGGEGSLTVSNGGIVEADSVLVNSLGQVHGNGSIIGEVENGGLVSPGTSPGALSVDGNYTQTANGALRIELASISSFDQLLVTGMATLAGTLDINLIDVGMGIFAPQAGNSFNILDWSSVTGTFSTIDLPVLGTGLSWNTSQLYTTGVLSVIISSLPGDFDGDGDVDGRDFLAWQRNPSIGNLADWQANYGTSPLSAASTAVPEPGTIVLLILAQTGLCLRRHRVAKIAPTTH